MRESPTLYARYFERFPRWWYLATQPLAEGPSPPRHLVDMFPRATWTYAPAVCLDGPTDSPHRNRELCLSYPWDPPERRWNVNDGLERLFNLARQHLVAEHIWRERGRANERDWPIEQAAHGSSRAARDRPRLALKPELPYTRTGNPALGVLR